MGDRYAGVHTPPEKWRRKEESRKRQRIYLTWSPELIQKLRQITDNISGFTERVL